MIVGTESLAFSGKEACRDKIAALRAAGVKHVVRYTTQEKILSAHADAPSGRMLYVVCWPKAEQAVLGEIETKVLLTQAEEVCNMENERGKNE